LLLLHTVEFFYIILPTLMMHGQMQIKFMIISRSILLRMRNVSDKICRKNQNTYFTLIAFFENRVIYNAMWKKKYCTAGHATAYHIIWRIRPACLITQAPKTHWEYVILLLSHYNNG
jgi:hypothetical protein